MNAGCVITVITIIIIIIKIAVKKFEFDKISFQNEGVYSGISNGTESCKVGAHHDISIYCNREAKRT